MTMLGIAPGPHEDDRDPCDCCMDGKCECSCHWEPDYDDAEDRADYYYGLEYEK